ncbi:MAG: hypothetical protein WC238_02115 [Parcubacteria group bacterium]
MKPKTKAPARNATHEKNERKSLVEMDTDEILETFGHCVAGGEKREVKKKPKMAVSGKKVFTLKEIIQKKAK